MDGVLGVLHRLSVLVLGVMSEGMAIKASGDTQQQQFFYASEEDAWSNSAFNVSPHLSDIPRIAN